MLSARGLYRAHPQGEGWLLEDVSFDVVPGERLVVVGPSGSGKTVLLRALALLDPADRGQVVWHGSPVVRHRVPKYRASVTYLHQRPALMEQTVEAALAEPFRLACHRRRRFDAARAAEWLSALGRDGSFLSKPVRELSGGESQIVALVRALELEPQVLLLDEPTAALDPSATSAAERVLLDWLTRAADRRAIVWVTHDSEQAARVATRTLSMSAGRLG